MSITKTTLLGAHMSIAGGLENALLEAHNLECTCVQLFTHSNRQWYAKPLEQEKINRFLQTKKQYPSIKKIIAHASYLLNLGSPDADTRNKSQKALIDDLTRCQQLTIDYLVLHPGARLTNSVETCLTHIAEGLDTVLNTVGTHQTMILLENTAGQGSVVGNSFEQLAEIRNQVDPNNQKYIGFCFDTCHAFAAGYDFRTSESYQQMWHDFNKIIGMKHLKAIHMNDSKKGLACHVDRHEHIGKGQLGIEPFKLIMNDPNFVNIPKILETPKDESYTEDKENLALLKSLIK